MWKHHAGAKVVQRGNLIHCFIKYWLSERSFKREKSEAPEKTRNCLKWWSEMHNGSLLKHISLYEVIFGAQKLSHSTNLKWFKCTLATISSEIGSTLKSNNARLKLAEKRVSLECKANHNSPHSKQDEDTADFTRICLPGTQKLSLTTVTMTTEN